MKRKLICISIVIVFLLLTLLPATAFQINKKKVNPIYEKTEEQALIISIPYLEEDTKIELIDGDPGRLQKIQDLLDGKIKFLHRFKEVMVRNISFNITYTGQKTRRATLSYIHHAYFIPHYNYTDVINKPFNCTIKNFRGYFFFYRAALHRPFLGFLCPPRVIFYGVCYNSTVL